MQLDYPTQAQPNLSQPLTKSIQPKTNPTLFFQAQVELKLYGLELGWVRLGYVELTHNILLKIFSVYLYQNLNSKWDNILR